MRYIYNFDEPPAADPDESLQLLGGKGHNLVLMRTELGLPVPPGFTITTQAWHDYSNDGWPDRLGSELRDQISRLGEQVGRQFGGPGEPLLVSVRSGASVSMPGMMDTILNLGLNEDTVESLAQVCGDPGFADDARARFLQMYRDIVGSDEVPSDPWQQLRGAIEAVFRSWDTDRARSYRERENIPHDLGTAVTVQTMVFGNLDDESATGVAFSRNPATGERELYGDVLFRAQGEDVVSGSHTPQPIQTLGERLPEVADELDRYSRTLEHYFRDVCDIEFTIERVKLWLLQVRVGKRSPHAALRFAVDMAEEEDFPLTRAEAVRRVARHLANPPISVRHVGSNADLLAIGLGASPGLASGRIATTADAAVSMAQQDHDVILVRPETSPDDVHGMARVSAILTSRGGLASHAAVVARGWAIPAVVGATSIEVQDGKVSVDGRTLREGETITIDGNSGEVFAGVIESESIISSDADKLLAWAEELNIDVHSHAKADESSVDADIAARTGILTADTIVHALYIKGFATVEALAPVVLSTPEAVQAIMESMEYDGLVKSVGEMFQLTDKGKDLGVSLMSRDRESWTLERANDALDSFLPLDQRMKEVVTTWQMREIDGEQVLNDHSDQAYDRRVLRDFLQLHRDAREWLEPFTGELERLQIYLHRLDRAASKVDNGDHAHIASPRLDSYHNVWFELHEDLIQLAGRTRGEETEAGRA